ncbi:hypothetical protein O6H91_13G002800 [Diphasiastrum complanatum]|uniref:Uncharacterized protein n=1 Tax=Diphasiastrum complanatum TaxID=34168 RepID=A0ACC2BRM7_DIPCM|nr:hypothetical protein O6H91_13G002800 [Diphasiastrum complanatum]
MRSTLNGLFLICFLVIAGQAAARVERLWQQFFSDPSQWRDARFDKGNPEAPDFKHKTARKSLWINNRFSPSWLQEKLATLTLQAPQQAASPSSSSLSTSQISSSPASRTKQLWEEFFSDPSQWWDTRSDKKNPKFPDFKHKTAKKALWIHNRLNPPWVHARLAAMVEGQQQGQSGSSTPESAGRVVRTEQLWKEFFSDPSQWWDNRFIKKSPKYPDFKHKSTHEGLWIEGWLTPDWVKAKMTTMPLVQIQSDGGLTSWSPDLNVSKLCQEGRLKEALHMVELMVQQNIQAPINTYACLLKWCTRKKALAEGKQVHALMIQSGLDSDIFLGNILVDMYAKCGSVFEAREVFDAMPEHNVFSWTAIISAYADHGQGEEAIILYQQMQQTGIVPDKVAFVVVLKACSRIAALEQGKQLHSDIIRSGFESDLIVGNTLIDMYAKCGCIEGARGVFNKLNERDVVSWNAMIAGYAQQGLAEEALAMYEQMKQEGVQPDNVTYLVLLKACASTAALEQGKQLHAHIIRSGFELDVSVGSALVDMYAKCGHIEHARQVFDNMSERNVVSWNAMMTGYAQQRLGKDALDLYEQMKEEGVQPDNVTYVVLLKACANIAAMEQGKLLHSHIIRSGFEADVIVGNTLVDMYAKCGSIKDACEVFNKMNERNVVSWNAMLAGYAQQGLGKDALALYEQMKQEGVQPDNVTYPVLLKACASIAALEQGKQLHSHIIRSGFESNVIVGSALVDMYAKCGRIKKAHKVFNNMHERNVVSWNALIAGYAYEGLCMEALDLYEQMKQEGMQPDNVTYVVLLKACARVASLEQGKQLHSDIIASGLENDASVGNTLVDMYAKCGCIEMACEVFNKINERNVVSWNAMIGGYAQQGLGKEALALYEQMKQEGVQPDNVTYVVLVNACARTEALEEGKQLHSDVIRSGFESDVIVGSALVDMYAKCGCIEHARQMFNKMSAPDVASWNALIAGYAQQGLGKEALALYDQMKQEGVQPDSVTYVVLLKACASIAALEQGKQLHSHIVRRGFELDVIVGSAIVDMYAKCGCIEDAREVFDNLHERDVVAWNAMIAGSAQQGRGKEALTLLEQMQSKGTKPNASTYIGVLTACSRSGLVDEGCRLFDSMCNNHGVTPTVDHYACMVDLLCRAGRLADAEDFINKMPIQPNAVVWMTLLAAARIHHNVEIGRRTFDCVVKLEPKNAAAYVLLSNIYAEAGRRDEVAKIRQQMKTAGLNKNAWVQLDRS